MTDLPLLFDCPKHVSLRLTAPACAGMWQKARVLPNSSIETVMKCRGCAIGAGHAGMKPELSRSVECSEKRCARCNRQARKLVWGDICLSCYNRQIELRNGINRLRTRGKLFWPKYARPLRPAAVWIRPPDAEGHGQQIAFDLVASGLEVALRTVRRAHGDVLIAFSRPLSPAECAAH